MLNGGIEDPMNVHPGTITNVVHRPFKIRYFMQEKQNSDVLAKQDEQTLSLLDEAATVVDLTQADEGNW